MMLCMSGVSVDADFELRRAVGVIERCLPCGVPVPWRNINMLLSGRTKDALGRDDRCREAVLSASVEAGVLVPVAATLRHGPRWQKPSASAPTASQPAGTARSRRNTRQTTPNGDAYAQ